MEDAFRLRFKVYCEEMHFLPAEDYPEQLEIDEFDDDAIHLLVHGDESVPIGYARILDGRAPGGFPMFAHGLTAYDSFGIPAAGTALELSRAIIRTDYRHRYRAPDDGFSPVGELPRPDTRSASDLILLKLLRQTYRQALKHDIQWIIGAMEPTMARKLRMIGMTFQPIGPSADYLGEVQPHGMNLRSMEERLEERFPKTFEFFASPEEDYHVTVVRPHEWSLGSIQHAA